jgi:membrane protease YdiL (CAAX protease family)
VALGACAGRRRGVLKRFAAFFGLFYLAWLIRATVFYSAVDLSIPGDTWRLAFSNLVKFGLWVVPAVLYILFLERQNPLAAMKITTLPDRRGLLLGLAVTGFYFVVIFGGEKYISGRTLAPLLAASPGLWLVTLAQVFFSPIGEELLFRGFVLPQLIGRFGFWIANALQSLLFTAMHWPNWLWVNGFQPWILTTSISIFFLGLLMGWLLRRTKSLWPPVAAHIVNNFLAVFVG